MLEIKDKLITAEALKYVYDFLSNEKNGTNNEIPVFDLVSLGLPMLDADSGATVRLETDATEILDALTGNMVRFVVSILYQGVVLRNVSLVVNPTGKEPEASWLTATIGFVTDMVFVNFVIDQTSITATAICNNLPVPTTADNGKVLQVANGAWKAVNGCGDSSLPTVVTADNGKVLQVVGGEWKAVTVSDSSVATFVDDYISEALGGDY